MPGGRPNALITIADEMGLFDVGLHHQKVMGATTGNIDRIAGDAVRLTDRHARASCFPDPPRALPPETTCRDWL
jgi:arylsulfatase A-like enzyme